jgi:hypothetical protein
VGYRVDPTADVFPEGLCLLEVVEVEEKRSRSTGDAYFKVKLRDCHTRQSFYENWMMQGRGQSMTVPKLKALGLDLANEIERDDLLGRRMVARIKHKENGEYGTQAQIARSWPEDSPPPEWLEVSLRREAQASATPPPSTTTVDDEPF